VDLRAQYDAIRHEIDPAMAAILENTSFILGEPVRTFEAAFAEFCDASHCVGVANGTDAIVLALKALGVGAGDEVVTVSHTFFATAGAVITAGAKPVFVDVRPDTQTLDPERFEAAITPRTKAILPVHLFGQPADMAPILEVATRHGLPVVEDAAQAHGATYEGRRVGSMGRLATFSFYPGKNLGAYGDGGAVVTGDAELAERVRMTRNHGRRAKYEHERTGVNSRLDALQAAVLSVKLRHLDDWNASRRRLAAGYDALLEGVDGVETPFVAPNRESVFHLYVIQVDDRDAVLARLKAGGIGAGVHYPIPLHLQPALKGLGYRVGDFPISERAAGRVLSLPLYPELTDGAQERVVEALKGAL